MFDNLYNLGINYKRFKMSNEQNLPDYKLRFLQEMEELRQEEARQLEAQNQEPLLNTTAQRYFWNDSETQNPSKTTSSTLRSTPPPTGDNTSTNPVTNAITMTRTMSLTCW